jgi:hypothetical protein
MSGLYIVLPSKVSLYIYIYKLFHAKIMVNVRLTVLNFRLRKQLETHSTCRLHQMLAEFLTQTHEHQEALDQFSIALR